MTCAWERRALRAVGAAAEHMTQSKWIIWCFEREQMSATIDLLVAQGSLSDSDRPRCVHWTAVRAPAAKSREEVAKTVDAEEMLSKAGIRTLIAEGWEAHMQGPGGLEAFYRDRFGELDAEDLKILDELEKGMPVLRERYAGRPFHDYGAAAKRHVPE
jgi:hypothetical protein